MLHQLVELLFAGLCLSAPSQFVLQSRGFRALTRR